MTLHENLQKFGEWMRRAAPGDLQNAGMALVLALVFAAAASAGTVSGVVRNGTNGKPAAGVDVILIQLQGGMQPVANTKTDAEGKYKIDNDGVGGQAPMLIRAVYRGVMFHQPVPPGKNTADVTVYEPSADAKTMKVGSRLIVFQTQDDNLMVGEEYSLQNKSQPPMAYFNEKGTFDFGVPQDAKLSQVASWGPAGMPVVQTTINRGARKYAIAYAFQPGDNGVRMSYTVPYKGNEATLHLDSPYATQRVMLIAPPTMKVTSPGFAMAGSEQGFNVYTRDDVPAGSKFDVALSGTAPPPPDPQGQGSEAEAGQDQVNGRATAAQVTTLPNRLDSLRWILIAGFASLFSLGLLLVWRKPVLIAAPVAEAPLPGSPGSAAGATTKSSPMVASNGPRAIAVEQQVEQSLEGLKDRLFRLELRRQAGTISEEQYAQERARTETILRELVQG